MRMFNMVLVLTLFVVVILSCGESKEERDRIARESVIREAKQQREKVMKELAKKHNALAYWDKGEVYYTVELQDLLLKPDKPVMCVGYIADIFRKNGKCYIRLDSTLWLGEWLDTRDYLGLDSVWLSSGPKMYFILSYDCDKVLEITSVLISKKKALRLYYQDLGFGHLASSTFFREVGVYVAVAKIHNVARPTLTLVGRPSDFGVELDYEPSDTFIATGDCIDLVHMDDATVLQIP